MGGTPQDSAKGSHELALHGIEAVPIAISPTPEIQAELHRQPALLAARVCERLSEYAPQTIVVNCVSMSFALDEATSYLPGYQIYELTSVFYQHIIQNPTLQHSTLGLIVADDITLRRILIFFEKKAFHPSLISVADIELVNLYEKSPVQGKRRLLRIIDGLMTAGARVIILGCTHLSDGDLPSEVDRNVRVIQPGLILLQQIIQRFCTEGMVSSHLHQLASY
jgi:hypothetical protein